jgi:hypothetical protein
VFCETFDTPNPGIPSRTGGLDPRVWGVSRIVSFANFGTGMFNGWAASTPIIGCNGTVTVSPPNDVMVCNGQLREATNDNPLNVFDAGQVLTLAMYPKQPFDFAGRTGTISFDISNDSHGSHAAWPEFWMSNLPVPAPFNHFDSWITNPQHGLALRFDAPVGPGSAGMCPNNNNLNLPRWTVGSAATFRNDVMEDVDPVSGANFGTPSAAYAQHLGLRHCTAGWFRNHEPR